MATIVPLPTDPMLKTVELEYRRFVVGKQMFCPNTQRVLDYRTAVIIENSAGDRLIGVVSPEAWRKVGAEFLAKFPDVILKNAPKGSPGTEAPEASPGASQSAATAGPAPDIQNRL